MAEESNDQVKAAEKESSDFIKALKKIHKASNIIEKVQKNVFVKATTKIFTGTVQAVDSVVQAANQRINAEQRLASVMSRNRGVTSEGIQLVSDYAQELTKTTAIASNVGLTGFSQLATHVEEPQNLKDLGDSLYNLATKMHGTEVSAENMTKVADIMGEALSGKTDALTKNGFVLTEQQENIFKYGTELEKTTELIGLIEGEIGGLAEAMANTPEGQIQQMKNSWNDVMEVIGFGLIPVILEFVNLINENMPIIEEIFMNVFYVVFGLLEHLTTIVGDTVSFFVDNWSMISPVIWGVVAALGAFLLMAYGATIATKMWTVVTKALTVAKAAFHAVMKLNPFVFIISLIVGLIVYLLRLWQTKDQFAEAIMKAWIAIQNFFDQVPIFFVKVWNGIVNGIMDMRVSVLEEFDKLINGVISGINWLMEKSNQYLGTSFEMIGTVDFATKEAAKAEVLRRRGEEKVNDMTEKAAQKALQRDHNLIDMFEKRAENRAKKAAEKEERFSMPNLSEVFGTASSGITIENPGGFDSTGFDSPVTDDLVGDIGKVGEVGKIRDSVDVSSEDIKMMRELAEMKNIQNFVSLTPSVSVQTGDITSGHDIDTIINRITNTLETQIASGAKGVWKV
ncbi:hypothetical protein [Bacillus horti]|uniref:Phage tail tape measure protein n=1 Tax=Caldalkalibacillus horti TaxID=77523 RepID=A0ABT9W0L4_9BACI|nr:hypothetical protein [Bacillus horti]MDQ0166639.1 hypothetical protein [Bacillus horti]